MITSKLQPASPCATIPPPISFPFLWKGTNTERIYLRIASWHSGKIDQEVDVRLVNGFADHSVSTPGQLVYTGTEDRMAWGQRLPAGETVILTNVT